MLYLLYLIYLLSLLLYWLLYCCTGCCTALLAASLMCVSWSCAPRKKESVYSACAPNIRLLFDGTIRWYYSMVLYCVSCCFTRCFTRRDWSCCAPRKKVFSALLLMAPIHMFCVCSVAFLLADVAALLLYFFTALLLYFFTALLLY